MLRWGWILWAITLGIAGVLLWRAPTEQLPVIVLVGALLLPWLLWRGGRWLWQLIRDAPHEAWNGRYFEFDGRQVRVLVDDDDTLWICAADVFDVLGLTGDTRRSTRVRLSAGRDGLRAAPGSRLLCFTERGLQAWLERRTEARVAVFSRWLNKQVLGPHHKRRTIAGYAEQAPDRIS